MNSSFFRIAVLATACSVSGCAEIGPFEGGLMRWISTLFVLVTVFFAVLSFAIEEKSGGKRWDNYCGICFFIAMAFLLVG